MKKLIFFVIFFLILGVFWLYTEINTRNFISILPQPPQSAERPEVNKLSTDKEQVDMETLTTPSLASTSEPPEQEGPNDEKSKKPTPTFDWRNDGNHLHENKPIDPLGDYMAEANKTKIDDPETMDPDELYNDDYNQLLDQFGDIPQVHAYMEYMRKFKNDVPMSLDEEIIGLEAMQHLFPAGSTRRTLDYYKWLRTKGDRGFSLEPGDLDYLRSLGIKINIKETDEEVKINISTR